MTQKIVLRGGKERFFKRIKDCGYKLSDESEYIKSGVHVILVCPEGHNYRVTPNKFQQGRRCSICGKRIKKNTESFSEEIKSLVGSEYEVMSDYITALKHVTMKHVDCGLQWRVTPSNFLSGKRCPKCSLIERGLKRRWTQSELEGKIRESGDNEYSVLSEYQMSNKKIFLKHDKCGYEWWAYPNNFIFHGSRCPSCVCVKSKGEEKIKETLDKLGIKYVFQATFEGLRHKGSLAYDFFIPSINLLIEFDGEQHYRPIEWFGGEESFKESKIRDGIKNDYAKVNGFELLRIPYWNEKSIKEILEREFKERCKPLA